MHISSIEFESGALIPRAKYKSINCIFLLRTVSTETQLAIF